MADTYIEVKALPEGVQRALLSIGYHRKDIAIRAAETFTFSGAWAAGYRALAMSVDLSTGETRAYEGSWGGSNPFEKRVADSGQTIPVAPGFAVIDANTGHKVFASIVVHPSTLVPLLPAPVELSELESKALRAFGYKPGEYRKRELRDVPQSVLDGLVSRGLLSRNRAGATQLTTAGRNAKPRSF